MQTRKWVLFFFFKYLGSCYFQKVESSSWSTSRTQHCSFMSLLGCENEFSNNMVMQK
ncbi:unnamed protein product [Ixodes pacificus]